MGTDLDGIGGNTDKLFGCFYNKNTKPPGRITEYQQLIFWGRYCPEQALDFTSTQLYLVDISMFYFIFEIKSDIRLGCGVSLIESPNLT